MPLKELLAEGRLRPHKSSRREIRDLLQVADRDLKDAAVKAISIDLRFQTAYQAALQLATIVLASSGYRAIGQGSPLGYFQCAARVAWSRVSGNRRLS